MIGCDNNMYDSFQKYHPIVNITYFSLTIVFALILVHPLAQGITILTVSLYMVSVDGKKGLMYMMKYCLPTILVTAFINPAFNHEGTTILLHFPNGNPLTLESILYGLSAGMMLVTLLVCFSNFNRVMTSDKFIYLFGRVIPALSLTLSMILRFVPRLKNQMDIVAEAQRGIGRDVYNGSLWQRIKTAVVILSIVITWSLENAIETADSMKSRGYGLKGRTAFSIYRFDDRDKYVLGWLGFCGIFILLGTITSAFGFRYFPNIRYAPLDRTTIPFYCVYFGMCITPVVINKIEENKWKTIYLNI